MLTGPKVSQREPCPVRAQAPKLDTAKLPSNARILTHANQCYDWGTFGWLLRSGDVTVKKYKYFVLLNSSVRGPYLPVYVPVRPSSMHLCRIQRQVLASSQSVCCRRQRWLGTSCSRLA